MIIERVQIEEGFLDGLDVSFSEGLNAIIGARGTGKSSLIELIRFCLNARSHSEEAKTISLSHAMSVLGTGKISVTVRLGNESFVISRSVEEEPQDIGGRKPLIFSQSEIEGVGLEADGRLRILDSFIFDNERLNNSIGESISNIRSLMSKISSVKSEIESLEEKIRREPEIESRLEALKPKEQDLAEASEIARQKLNELQPKQQEYSTTNLYYESNKRFGGGVLALESSLTSIMKSLSSLNEIDLNEDLKASQITSKLSTQLKEALDEIRKIEQFSNSLTIDFESKRKQLDNEIRDLRVSIDETKKGAGQIISELQRLNQIKDAINGFKQELKVHLDELKKLVSQRDLELDQLESFRNEIFEKRIEVESHLNDALQPEINIEVYQSGQTDSYSAALMDSLKGSGLQYRNLASTIADKISPRELLELVESLDVNELSSILEVSQDRALKILGTLSENDLGQIATVAIEDSVNYSLLDGGDYKKFNQLSVGQRCTLILPILMEQKERVIIIDQPEDHIDNAFITNTLIKSIRSRSSLGQMILSTHNANIPVLGEANRVIQLASDGNRGYVEVEGHLDDYDVVNSISTIMEGGVDAFRNRARFYESLNP